MSEIKALLLAGGYGTRLFPLSMRIPKAMVPVAGKPVLEHLVRVCTNAGITDIIISLNTNQRVIEEYFGDGKRFNANITYAYETSANDADKLGAIGAIQYALKNAGEMKECVVLGGDNVFYGLDLHRMRQEHKAHGASASIALYTLSDVRDAPQYGMAKVDEQGRLLQFKEKPAPEEVFSDKVATAAYHLEESFLKEYLPAYVDHLAKQGKKADKLGDLWAHFVKDLPLYGHAFHGMWGDTNNSRTYIEAHKQAMAFVSPTSLTGLTCSIFSPGNVCVAAATISPDATIKGPVIIEDGCVIEAGAVVGPGTHLMKNVFVGKSAIVTGSVVFRDCRIEDHARVSDSVLDIGAKIEEKAIVEPYCIIGYKARVGTCSMLSSESRLWPFCETGPQTALAGDVIANANLTKLLITDALF